MKISVITITYNNVDGLRRTIASVVSQTYSDYEYVIIDGGSTDGSVEVIREYKDKITYWVSEKDGGIYNAMNKGVAVANGDYCIFMNSGDCFYNNTVLDDIIKQNPKEDIFVGIVIASDTKRVVSPTPMRDISLYHLYSGAIPHQGAFIKTSLLRELPYDETMKISADWKFFVQAVILRNCSLRYIEQVIAVYDMTGISTMHGDKMLEEKKQYLSEILPVRILADYKHMKDSECLTQTITPMLRKRYSIDRLLYRIGKTLLKIKH